MNVSKLKQHPWVIGVSKNVRRGEIKRVSTFFNKELAIYRGDDNQVHCMSNICPHRGARMSQGKVKGNCIECPYHGWVFDKNGVLIDVPSTSKDHTPKNSDLEPVKIKEDNGFIWALPDTWDDKDLPTSMCEEFNSPGWNKVYGSREVKGWWGDWIDNALDVSHINYVHDFADENDGLVSNMKVDHTDRSVICTVGVNPKATTSLTEGMQVKTSQVHSEFVLPNSSIIKIKLKDPYEFVTVTSVLPINETTSRLSWCFLYNIDIPFVKDFASWRFDEEMYKTVLEDEKIIKNLQKLTKRVNVSADAFQLQALKRLMPMIE